MKSESVRGVLCTLFAAETAVGNSVLMSERRAQTAPRFVASLPLQGSETGWSASYVLPSIPGSAADEAVLGGMLH